MQTKLAPMCALISAASSKQVGDHRWPKSMRRLHEKLVPISVLSTYAARWQLDIQMKRSEPSGTRQSPFGTSLRGCTAG